MKYTSVILFIILLSSCLPRVRPVKNDYLDPPFQATSTSSKDVVWNKIVDFFSDKRLPIKSIDKSSGLIISEKAVFSTTIEDKDGKLVNKSAWVVVPAVYNPNTKKLESYYTGKVLGEWSIRIKESVKGTVVSVNLVNLKRQFTAYKMGLQEVDASFAKSTGVFEKQIADLVK
jgi:hypothetical protein